MSRVKVSRKKLLQEPDEFLSLSQRAWLWLHGNRDRAALIGVGIVAVVLLVVGVRAYGDRARGQRAAAVSGAVSRYVDAAGSGPSAETLQELATLAERHAGSAEGILARFFQAGSLATSGDADGARRIFTELSTGAGDVGVLSRVALAYLELAHGEADAALASFRELLKVEGTGVPRAQIMAEIAAIHEKQGRPAEAQRAYRDLIAEHPDGSWAGPARQRLQLLGEPGAPTS